MNFTFEAFTDGACRRNGSPNAVGGAGVHFPRYMLDGRPAHQSIPLPCDPIPTNNRAELTAIIYTLRAAHHMQHIMSRHQPPPLFRLTVHSDSQYAVNCMTVWIDKWLENGWIGTDGGPVKNKDLITEIRHLTRLIEESYNGGQIIFNWIRREENEKADEYANIACDLAEQQLQTEAWRSTGI
ncbi:ribonuclease H-like domain-containing protein [Mycena vitilis]|nr:ribonuclease H-like domain-containing protein [Mycena vitilis]